MTSDRQTRREMFSGLSKLAGAALLMRPFFLRFSEAETARYAPKLVVQSYIWMQQLETEKKTLGDGVDEALSSFHQAGYHLVELGSAFFTPELRDKTLALLETYKLVPETFFPNTTMYEAVAAGKSVDDAMGLARLLKPYGTRVIIINPSPKPDKAPKTDEELNIQARYVNQLAGELDQLGMKLALHHHTPELVDNQREWRHLMKHTDPNRVYCCVDLHWAYRGGQDPMTFLRAVGDRLLVLHLRNSRQGIWMEDFGPGDIDYGEVANYLRAIKFDGYLDVELAYEKGTEITRPLTEDLRLSRLYTEKIFGLAASA